MLTNMVKGYKTFKYMNCPKNTNLFFKAQDQNYITARLKRFTL